MTSSQHADNRFYLYGSPVSFYTVKVRSYLHYKGLPFVEVRATNKISKEFIEPATGGWRVIPVLKTPQGHCIQDSSIILDELESAYTDRSITPPGLKQQVVSSLFELLGDEWLVFPAMHYRWNFKKYNLKYILNAFGQSRSPHWPKAVRFLGGIMPALIFGNVPRFMLGINKKNSPALEVWTRQLLDQLDIHFSKYNYLLGARACYGDFAVYGPLHAHLALDPYPKEHLIKSRKNVIAWLERMDKTPKKIGDWLPNDDIPATLIPILHSQCQDQLPCIHRLMDKTRDWINKHPAEITLPRFIGKVDYQINGAEGKRLCTPYTQWMYERVLAPIHAAVEPQRAELTQWLSQQNIPFKPIQPKDSLVFRQSRLWRKAKL